MPSHEDQLKELLSTYERSLNTSDADLAASCYADDGVFMPTNLPTVAAPDIAAGYRGIFSAIRLDVTFTIDELVVTSYTTAYAVTRSSGTQTVLESATESAESNREIFLFQRRNPEGWKISRYMFNKAQ